jgi:hypothetical protein
MIDTLLKHKEPACGIGLVERWGLKPGGFGTVALHRPSNIYDRTILGGIPDALNEIAKEILIIFLMSEGLLKSAYRFLNAKILGADAIAQ